MKFVLSDEQYEMKYPFTENHETSHLNAIDENGMIAQVTSSINHEFREMPLNTLAPRKRPFSFISPIILWNLDKIASLSVFHNLNYLGLFFFTNQIAHIIYLINFYYIFCLIFYERKISYINFFRFAIPPFDLVIYGHEHTNLKVKVKEKKNFELISNYIIIKFSILKLLFFF